jgi:hypothetical protein
MSFKGKIVVKNSVVEPGRGRREPHHFVKPEPQSDAALALMVPTPNMMLALMS